ncbi:MAG: pyridoxine 5'-phosphate synthase [Gammaproteobacteria bacterium]
MRSILLGVNVDHVATLRQCRLAPYPDPVHAALMAEQAGADSITLHLREDRRHIQERDVRLLKEMKQVPMNLEMAMTEEMLSFAEKLKPEFCCLVPERREELTTEGGLDVSGQLQRVQDACQRLMDAGIRVSLFIDAEPGQIEAAGKSGTRVIEIHTGHFATATRDDERQTALEKIIRGAGLATQLGMYINAGHGLNYQNVQAIAAIPDIAELNIGHAIIARAVFTGLPAAVMEIKRLMLEA